MWRPFACAGLLGAEISIATPLMEAGLDSIGAVEMRNAVNDKYGIELPATIMFDYPTIGDLAQYLALRTASSAMHASAGGLDQMQAYVPDASAAFEIAKVFTPALVPCLCYHTSSFLVEHDHGTGEAVECGFCKCGVTFLLYCRHCRAWSQICWVRTLAWMSP